MKESEESNIDRPGRPDQSDSKYIPGNYKLNSINWLSGYPPDDSDNEILEIRFKNTRKGFYRNVNMLRLDIGDIVAVEASPGHDIGRISMIGKLVNSQMKTQKGLQPGEDYKKIYRKAKAVDIEKWEEAKSREVPTMLKSRKIAEELGLNMKIGDVEYQGDKTKAIFYYIADERVDFRQLIKTLAEQFKVRIEMRQIGARQEAGRIGGIGSCGRELCCSSHMKNFVSVTTSHAKLQELSLNPQKLAGQCSKLKCCLNYELDSYIDKQSKFPPKEVPLQTDEGTAYFVKTEVHKEIYWYSFDQNSIVNFTAVTVKRVGEIQEMNRNGKNPQKLAGINYETVAEHSFEDSVGTESITRFDRKKSSKRGNRNKNRRKNRHNDKKR